MSGSNSIKAGQAHVEIGATDSKLKTALEKAKADVMEWGKSVTAIGGAVAAAGAAIVVPITAAAQAFAEAGAELAGVSRMTGLAVENLSAFSTVVPVEDIGRATTHMRLFMAQAARGGAEATEVLRAMGTSFAEIRTMSPDEQFRRIADGLASIRNVSDRTADAMRIFGETGGPAMLRLMSAGSAGLDQMRERAEQLGLVMRSEDAQAARGFTNEMKLLGQMFVAIRNAIGAAVIPQLRQFAQIQIGLIQGAVRWVQQNRELIGNIFRIGSIVFAVGTAIATLGVTLIGTAAAVIGFVAALPILKTGLIVVGAAIAVAVQFGLVAYGIFAGLRSALSAFGLDWQTVWESIGNVARRIINGFLTVFADPIATFRRMLDTFQTTFGTIVDYLMAGDLQGAARAAFAGMELAWLQMQNLVLDVWDSILTRVIDVMQAMIRAVSASSRRIAESIAGVFNTMLDAMPESVRSMMGINRIEVGTSNPILDRATAFLEGMRPEVGGAGRRAAGEADLRARIEGESMQAWFARQVAEVMREMPTATPAEDAARTRVPDAIRGSFGGFGIESSLNFGGSAMDRTARATEESRDLLRRIADREPAPEMAGV